MKRVENSQLDAILLSCESSNFNLLPSVLKDIVQDLKNTRLWLRKAAVQFSVYEQAHLVKKTADGDTKAATNRAWAVRCAIHSASPDFVPPKEHVFHERMDHEDPFSEEANRCQACILSSCLICGGAEADLPTECPGRKMTEGEMTGISGGKLDFKNGAWQAKDISNLPDNTSGRAEVEMLRRLVWLYVHPEDVDAEHRTRVEEVRKRFKS